MSADLRPDICVIGGGSAGLAVTAAAAQFGASTVLIESGKMGGECLNTGCVPSKALLAAAKTASRARTSGGFGVDTSEPTIDFGRVRRHVHDVIGAIAPHDSAARFESMGAQVVRAEARFLNSRELTAGNHLIRARRFVIATGSLPDVPAIPGLDQVAYFTNETIFENDTRPDHLVVMGGGPLGMELAQAHRRLGSQVTVVESSDAMSKDDRELAESLLKSLADEGIAIRQRATIKQVEKVESGISLTVEEAGQMSGLVGSHLLVATGRRPNVAALDLETAGVEHNKKGIVVDTRLRTTARGIYAMGDVVGGPQFTHVANYHAGIVIRNALFYFPAKVDYRALPWVTYTEPELAQAGMTEEKARQAHGDDVVVVSMPFARNDRAQTERETRGAAKIVARRNGRVLGASILGAHAGELIHVWVLAIERGLKLKDIARMIAPYPTLGEIEKAAASEFYKPKLFNDWSRGLVRLLSWLP